MRYTTAAIAAALVVAWPAVPAGAQPADTLKAAVEQAVLGNPDVTARFNAYRASLDALDVARAAYRPRVDLSASTGRDNDRITSRTPETLTQNRNGAALSLTQLLWDGLGTQRDIERSSHEKLARYFEFLDATEQTALDAARAYYDVQRYRQLVQLAEENYVQHKYVTLQIQSRFKAGVGRGVDLEQANARLALAESNLSTELANLHDVTARYQRVVGSPPPAQLPEQPTLLKGLPEGMPQTMEAAVRRNAGVSASIESLRAARSAAQQRESAYQPRLEARVRSGAGHNFDAITDQKRDTSAEIVLNWNLYNGGADQARVRQQRNLLSQASDQRDKTCRDTRQLAAIAFNDTRKLAEQLELLDRNTIAIEKARDAYRQQFDIGQRSLLDLLNAENEVYTAKRSYANADFDLSIAHARTHAALSQLTAQLGITRGDQDAAQIADWAAGEDAPSRCPIVTSEVAGTDRALLDERARQIAATLARPLPPAAPATGAAAAAPAASAPAGAASRPPAPRKR